MNYKKHVITGFKTEVKYTNILIKNLVSRKSKVQSAGMQAVLFCDVILSSLLKPLSVCAIMFYVKIYPELECIRINYRMDLIFD